MQGSHVPGKSLKTVYFFCKFQGFGKTLKSFWLLEALELHNVVMEIIE